MTKHDGGAAFPQMVRREELSNNDHYVSVLVPEGGMSLRDYFAAKALVGLVSYLDGEFEQALGRQAVKEGVAQAAERCYAIADAMLKERAK